MPFRYNFFGAPSAQPGTTFDEIEQSLIDREGIDTVECASADLFLNGDDQFKFGGTLHFTTSIVDDETGDPEYYDSSMEFDGFESLDDAKAWLNSFAPGIDIYEVA